MADKGGKGGLDPPFLADTICEQPLIPVPSLVIPGLSLAIPVLSLLVLSQFQDVPDSSCIPFNKQYNNSYQKTKSPRDNEERA